MKLYLIRNKKRQPVAEDKVNLEWIDVKFLADSHTQMRRDLLLAIRHYKQEHRKYTAGVGAIGLFYDSLALLVQRYQLDECLRQYQTVRRDFRQAYDSYLQFCLPEPYNQKSKIYS